jgi:hypothetical protein
MWVDLGPVLNKNNKTSTNIQDEILKYYFDGCRDKEKRCQEQESAGEDLPEEEDTRFHTDSDQFKPVLNQFKPVLNQFATSQTITSPTNPSHAMQPNPQYSYIH